MRRARQLGITLVEVMVTVAVIALLLMVAVPNFRTFIQNTQIRTAADGVLNGLQAAKNEAIRRNASMQLRFTTGGGWELNSRQNPNLDPPIMARHHEEGSANAAVTLTPGGADRITFNALGRIDTNEDGSAPVTQIDIDNPLMAAADSRELRIVIPPGGAIRLCDPQVAAGDPRAC